MILNIFRITFEGGGNCDFDIVTLNFGPCPEYVYADPSPSPQFCSHFHEICAINFPIYIF